MDNSKNIIFKNFPESSKGIHWALSQLNATFTEDQIKIDGKTLKITKNKKLKGDAFSIKIDQKTIALTINSTTSSILSLTYLKTKLESKSLQPESISPKFKTRFFKHEISFTGPTSKNAKFGSPITEYSDDFIESFVQYVASRGFNAIVFYAGYHPCASTLICI